MNMKDFWTQVVLERGVDEANRAVAEMKRLFPEKAGFRVGDLEIAPVSMWRIREWDDGMAYCEALGDGRRMPTKDELDEMRQDEGFKSLFVDLYGDEAWIWSSSELSANDAWIQRPSGALQPFSSKYNEHWVVPCRRFI